MTTTLKQGHYRDLTVDSLDAKGRGTALVDDVTVTFRGLTLPGDRGRAQIVRRKGPTAEAVMRRMDWSAEPRVTTPCRHVESCGSCRWQPLSRHVQTGLKNRMVKEVMEKLLPDGGTLVKPTLSPGWPYFYRNKMEFSFADFRGGFRLGLHEAGRYNSVFDVEECLLQSPVSNRIVSWVRSWAKENDLPVFHTIRQTGCLRYLVVREAKSTGQVMVNLVTAQADFDGKSDFASGLSSQIPEITSLWLTVNDTKSAVATGEYTELLAGSATIEEHLGDLKFQISPQSFFQTNSLAAEVLYREIAEQAVQDRCGTILDVCCGTGTIGLWLAGRAEKVLGIESVPDAVEDAKVNAKINQIDNAAFICGKAEELLPNWSDEEPEVIVIDPPRPGLHAKALGAVAGMGAERIVYVSCNPQNILSDLPTLLGAGYEIGSVQPVDMFPHTPHVETVVGLVRKAA